MDELVTQADQWHRSQLSRQLKKLVRGIAVLGYCEHDDAMPTVTQSINDVEQTLSALSASPSSVTEYLQHLETSILSDNQRLLMEAHSLLTQARLLLSQRTERCSNNLNVIDMRQNKADLVDAAFERMLAASNTPCLYSSSASDGSYMGLDAAFDQDDARHTAANKTTNKRLSTHLKLVVDNSDSLLPVNSGDQ
ncbi:MAG TPA: hypothetical protein DCE61_06540 [Cellvibrionales bacterium]|jgi:hypothetical protein|nr:hypothetical protein [Cellvibrionales bacterium]HAW14164.1 hypothetical protein [Cellvibrionales bacterium]HCX27325.1 hypothetical protein [Cellvibrionales bacterium]